jgi:endonuclease/exonuclease/phosphatase family metal-dependent hydrolase
MATALSRKEILVSNADRSPGTWGRLHWVGLAALVAALGLCLMPGAADAKKKKKDTVKVATYNLYLGANLTRAVVAAREGEGVPGPAGQAARLKAFDHFGDQVGVILRIVQANDFNVRARTIANQIKKNKVDLVGLQEAALFRLEIPTDGGAPGGLNPTATFALVPLIDFLDTLLNALNKKALTKKQCKNRGLKGSKCYRGYYLASAPVEADVEFPGDFDNNPGPNGIHGEGPAFNATTGFPPCDSGVPAETNPGGDDTGVELGDPGPPNPFGIEKDPVTGQPTPWDWNGDSSSNTAQGGTRNCGPDTLSGDFDTTPPPSGGFQYASDCPDNNPIGGRSAGADDKSDTVSSCLFHGIDGDARLTIRDAIIARKGAGVKTSNPTIGQFSDASTLKIPVFGGATSIPFTRGWTFVDANVRGKKFRLVNTHLEAESVGTVREDQASELVASGGPGAVPNTVLIGDLNSDPARPPVDLPDGDGGSNIAINRLFGAGYRPVQPPGPTGGHGELLNDLSIPLGATATPECVATPVACGGRIDHILTNSPSIRLRSGLIMDPVGGGLWASDHGGVLSRLAIPGGKK